VIRGGGFDSSVPEQLMAVFRAGLEQEAHPHAVGFRCAADPL
jgi:formylglycine-generating enzyme required for sulfatase activity